MLSQDGVMDHVSHIQVSRRVTYSELLKIITAVQAFLVFSELTSRQEETFIHRCCSSLFAVFD